MEISKVSTKQPEDDVIQTITRILWFEMTRVLPQDYLEAIDNKVSEMVKECKAIMAIRWSQGFYSFILKFSKEDRQFFFGGYMHYYLWSEIDNFLVVNRLTAFTIRSLDQMPLLDFDERRQRQFGFGPTSVSSSTGSPGRIITNFASGRLHDDGASVLSSNSGSGTHAVPHDRYARFASPTPQRAHRPQSWLGNDDMIPSPSTDRTETPAQEYSSWVPGGQVLGGGGGYIESVASTPAWAPAPPPHDRFGNYDTTPLSSRFPPMAQNHHDAYASSPSSYGSNDPQREGYTVDAQGPPSAASSAQPAEFPTPYPAPPPPVKFPTAESTPVAANQYGDPWAIAYDPPSAVSTTFSNTPGLRTRAASIA